MKLVLFILILSFIAFISYTIYRTVYLCQNLQRVKAMKRKAEELKQEEVTPYGSSLSYGLSIDKNGKYVHESKESLIWYKRLLN